MGRDRPVVGVREGRNLPRLGEPAAPRDVRHDDAARPGLEEVAELPLSAQGLAHADRDAGLRGVVRQGGEAVHADRVLVPKGVEGLEGGRDPDRGGVPPERVQLHHDVHPVPHCTADLPERLEPAVEVAAGDVVPVRLDRRVIEGPDLHPRDALLEEALRELVGPVEEGVEVLVGAFRLPLEPPVVRPPVGAAPDVAVARAGVVGADPLPREPAQQLVDRLPGGLPEEVPERDVHRRPPPGLDSGAGEADVGRQIAADPLDGEGVASEHRHRRRFVEIRFDGPCAEERLPEPDEPLVGVHPHPEHVRELVEPHRLERSDLHASRPSFLPAVGTTSTIVGVRGPCDCGLPALSGGRTARRVTPPPQARRVSLVTCSGASSAR